MTRKTGRGVRGLRRRTKTLGVHEPDDLSIDLAQADDVRQCHEMSEKRRNGSDGVGRKLDDSHPPSADQSRSLRRRELEEVLQAGRRRIVLGPECDDLGFARHCMERHDLRRGNAAANSSV